MIFVLNVCYFVVDYGPSKFCLPILTLNCIHLMIVVNLVKKKNRLKSVIYADTYLLLLTADYKNITPLCV